jgi:1-acyl-sn-glycerol-3-phosphate acyltransferase
MDYYWFFKTFAIKPFLRVRYHVKHIGKRHLPKVESAIIAVNHLAKIDSPMIAARVKAKVVFGAKKEYFAGKRLLDKLTKWFLTAVDQMPVDRTGRGMLQFIQDAIRVIQRRQAWLGIHFEGTRSPDGRLYKAHIGVAKIALATHVPIIPTAVIGTNGERMRWWRRIRVTIIHGEPIYYEQYKGMTPAALAELVGKRVQQLSGQEYVDTHAPIVVRDNLK